MKDPKGERERWFEQARRDLEAAEGNLSQGYWWVACFLSQQAAEKAVKAYLYGQGERLVLGHSVAQLVRDAATHDALFAGLGDTASKLDRFYIPTRYPNGLPGGIPADSYSEQDARQAIDLARQVLQSVEERL